MLMMKSFTQIIATYEIMRLSLRDLLQIKTSYADHRCVLVTWVDMSLVLKGLVAWE